ncbi:tRNA (N6-threonylcarbamoyladenosine(37)-N6)-methyltransferase TrmO [Actinobacillus succinogenes]|uniref:TsaA-like domain-containing protein n=1 Tax=Actinobacillus succinogenes (strain ATCC 55618 / DSM 22257 / CCUG 43843 / 130Z) TaxID=339671 RepID=A6VLP2_ACTSZ|nr:tRNA (N6-threonylcarbamoyladenosine(37)-N6)-methyltransferase TrmO [Actinobacillus succinogenes]ABR73889.1 protein of unknown function UPF0066 [Actinobacillus succinogenes 130Z]PHI41206.1 tRNA (N6-threonylcarbamoyladenosine(37)-N6)-methyltransferase TrmO [Actinobacillus succinogenes]
MSDLTLTPIAVIHTPYKEKFSVPRQPDLIQDGTGVLELLPPYNIPESVRGLEQFSHLWLIFQFDRIERGKWNPTVRPPRLGGNRRMGVFATRSTHRPNPLGLSKVALKKIECENGNVKLYLGAVDLVDGTPILDIKPYIAYADQEPNAISGFAQHKPKNNLAVTFTEEAKNILTRIQQKYPFIQRFITEVLQQDPRPAYHQEKNSKKIYGIKLYDYNIRFQFDGHIVKVIDII